MLRLEKQQRSDVQLSERLAIIGTMRPQLRIPPQIPWAITALLYWGV